jgi:hypothetical protein
MVRAKAVRPDHRTSLGSSRRWFHAKFRVTRFNSWGKVDGSDRRLLDDKFTMRNAAKSPKLVGSTSSELLCSCRVSKAVSVPSAGSTHGFPSRWARGWVGADGGEGG